MKKFFSVLVTMLVFSAALCIFGCSKSSSSASAAVGDEDGSEAATHRFNEYMSPLAKTIDLSGLGRAISFDDLDLSETDRIYVQLAYCDPDIYSYWIEDEDTISKVSDIVKEIDGEELFYPQGMFGLSLCITFYSGDSEVFYIGVGGKYFESGTKIEDNIDGATGYMDGYCYGNGTEKEAKELIRLLAKPEWGDR